MSTQELITEHLDLWTSATTHAANGRGKNGKIELTGIKKLRELILELAVRGKLTPQNPDDKPADELLTEICNGNAKYARKHSSGTKNGGEHSEKNRDDFLLPEGWTWTDLNCVSRITGGGTPKSKEPEYWSDDGIKWLTPADLYGHDEKYIGSGKRDISESGLKNSSAQLLPAGTVLFSSRAPIGHVAIAKNELCTNQGFKSCIPHHDGMSEYLYYFLKRSAKHIDASASGTTFKEISGSKMARVRVALPPLTEQHRIVQKVDELMALCDRLEQQTSDQLEAHETLVDTLLGTLTQSENATELADNWARLAAHFDTLFTTEQSIERLKQTILQLAVMGRLTEQDSEDTSPERLIEAISNEKRELIASGKIRKMHGSHSLNSEPLDIPDNWKWTSLESLFAVVTDGDHQAPPKSQEGIPFLMIGNLNTGTIDFTNCKHVNQHYYNELEWSRKPGKGDLLYTVTGSYGIPIKVETEREFCVQRHVAIFRATESTPTNFITLLLQSTFGKDYADSIATGIAQKTVPLGGLRNMPVPLPPLDERNRIVTKVDELIALCDELKGRLTDANEIRSQLARSIVEQAL